MFPSGMGRCETGCWRRGRPRPAASAACCAAVRARAARRPASSRWRGRSSASRSQSRIPPMAFWTDLPADVLGILRRGTVLPAHPLALDHRRQFDRVSQRALTRYYIDAGAGGLAVGVHATQFAIREAGLYRAVLELAAEAAGGWSRRPLLMIAGVIGRRRDLPVRSLPRRPVGTFSAARRRAGRPARPRRHGDGLQQRDFRRRQRLCRLYRRLPRGAAASGPLRKRALPRPQGGSQSGQAAGLDRITAAYPELNDNAFVRANLERWRS